MREAGTLFGFWWGRDRQNRRFTGIAWGLVRPCMCAHRCHRQSLTVPSSVVTLGAARYSNSTVASWQLLQRPTTPVIVKPRACPAPPRVLNPPHRVPAGASQLEAEDWDTGSPVVIPLDPTLTPMEVGAAPTSMPQCC